jgi:hypothetical protein
VTVPTFTAEASLGGASTCYMETTGRAKSDRSREIIPQLSCRCTAIDPQTLTSVCRCCETTFRLGGCFVGPLGNRVCVPGGTETVCSTSIAQLA